MSERNKKFNGVSFNRRKLAAISSYNDFEKMYGTTIFLDEKGKPYSDQKDRLKKAYDYLFPAKEVAKKS